MKSMKSVALITFGCAKNLVDSEVMAGHLENAGYVSEADLSRAGTIILNTCGFISPARAEAEAAIRDSVRLKKKDPSKKIIVTGCYPERSLDELRRRFPAVDGWLGVKDFDRIVDVIEGRSFAPSEKTFLYDHRTPRLLSTPPSWAYVKISEGCSHECAFCSIPLIKGPFRSRHPSSIVKEVEHLAALGVKEINLVSQDTTFYGKDLGQGTGLSSLLKKLVKINGVAWVRVLYGYPEEITEELLETMCEPKICAYLDIPFQHSDLKMTRRMKRGMDGRRALKLLAEIRRKLPEVSVRTSLMVGFPGESREEFENLKTFVREARFDHLGVFTYSRESGTAAHGLGDPIGEKIKLRRKDKILEIQAEISSAKLRARVGQTLEVLVEGRWIEDTCLLIGRGRFQAPEVDGVIFIPSARDETASPGPLRAVEITGSEVYDLRGKFAG